MALKFVVGLFETRGIAEDAVNRLKTEGVAADLISLLVLHEAAPTPAVVEPELEALSLDPFVIGDVRHSFAPVVSNGETAVFVLAHSEEDVDQAVDTIRQYSPMRIRVVAPHEGEPLGRDLL